jgi:hypothetical protein
MKERAIFLDKNNARRVFTRAIIHGKGKRLRHIPKADSMIRPVNI